VLSWIIAPTSSAVGPPAAPNPSAALPFSVHNPVDTGPGLTEVTRMFLAANSFDNVFMRLVTAALVAL
jgi:hypothetical protein